VIDPASGRTASGADRPLSPAAAAAGSDARAGHTWLLESFVRRTRGVTHAIVISGDGLVLTASTRQTADRSDQLAAVAAGLASLSLAAAGVLGSAGPLQTTVELDDGLLVVRPLGDPSAGTVLALTRADADLGDVGYELTLLTRRIRRATAEAPRGPRGPVSITTGTRDGTSSPVT
jgi:hypothetical protein